MKFIATFLAVASASAAIYDYQTWTFTDTDNNCQAGKDLVQYKPPTLKMEYLWVQAGVVTILTTDNNGCESYDSTQGALVKANSNHNYVTASGATIQDFRPLWQSSSKQASSIALMVNFVVQIGFTGLELDWEDYWNWSTSDYTGFQEYCTALANALHAKGKKLMIDIPGGTNNLPGWNWAKFNALPIDYFCVMAYGNFYDTGAGTASAPNSWLTAIVKYLQANVPNHDRLVIGIPGDCYYGAHGSYDTTELAWNQVATSANGFSYATAPRDPNSGEVQWTHNGIFYSCSDSTTLNERANLLAALGVGRVSTWYMGGNHWFTNAFKATGS